MFLPILADCACAFDGGTQAEEHNNLNVPYIGSTIYKGVGVCCYRRSEHAPRKMLRDGFNVAAVVMDNIIRDGRDVMARCQLEEEGGEEEKSGTGGEDGAEKIRARALKTASPAMEPSGRHWKIFACLILGRW
jgi:hypothetical protein